MDNGYQLVSGVGKAIRVARFNKTYYVSSKIKVPLAVGAVGDAGPGGEEDIFNSPVAEPEGLDASIASSRPRGSGTGKPIRQ